MRRSEAHEPAGRLVIGAPRQSTLVDLGALGAFFAFARIVVPWVLARIDDGSDHDRTLILLYTAMAVTAVVAVALLVVLRAYRRAHPGKSLILDRRRNTVTLGDEQLCVLSEVTCVELRRRQEQNESPSYRVGLIVASLRAKGAPRAAPSIFDDTIAVNESIDAREMRAYARRSAAFAGVPVEEVGS